MSESTLESLERLKYQPSYIQFLEYTEEELDLKIRKMTGIISSHLSISMEKSIGDKYTANRLSFSMENLIFAKIRSSEVSKRIFLYWFQSNEVHVDKIRSQGSLGRDISMYGIAHLIANVTSESLNI